MLEKLQPSTVPPVRTYLSRFGDVDNSEVRDAIEMGRL